MKQFWAIGGLCIIGLLGLSSLADVFGVELAFPGFEKLRTVISVLLFLVTIIGGYVYLIRRRQKDD